MSTATFTASGLSTPHLRLTARGRAVFSILGAIVMSVVMAAVILGGASATASGEAVAGSGESTSFDYVQVEAGQSLWQLAESIAPHADPREVVYSIVKLNQLPTADVQPGQQLAIPLEYSR